MGWRKYVFSVFVNGSRWVFNIHNNKHEVVRLLKCFETGLKNQFRTRTEVLKNIIKVCTIRINALVSFFQQQINTAAPKQVFLWLVNSVKPVRTAGVRAKLWLRKCALKIRVSESVTATSPASKAGARTTPIRLCAIWLGFVEQYENEYCTATKWLNDNDGQVHGDKTPIVHNTRSGQKYADCLNWAARVGFRGIRLVSLGSYRSAD